MHQLHHPLDGFHACLLDHGVRSGERYDNHRACGCALWCSGAFPGAVDRRARRSCFSDRCACCQLSAARWGVGRDHFFGFPCGDARDGFPTRNVESWRNAGRADPCQEAAAARSDDLEYSAGDCDRSICEDWSADRRWADCSKSRALSRLLDFGGACRSCAWLSPIASRNCARRGASARLIAASWGWWRTNSASFANRRDV